MRGKTGTLSGVAALSGFVSVGGDDTLCFAILTNGFRDRRKTAIRAAQAQMVDAMVRLLAEKRGQPLSEPAFVRADPTPQVSEDLADGAVGEETPPDERPPLPDLRPF